VVVVNAGRKYEYRGQSLTLRQWSRKLRIAPSTLKTRAQRGLSVEEILAPLQRKPIADQLIPGKRLGRWEVLELLRPNKNGVKGRVLARCECGTVKDVDANSLLHGGTTSCGCWNRDYNRKLHTKYGDGKNRGTRLFRIWWEIKMRCHHPDYAAYADYGAKGIVVCEEWRWNFENFRRDMGERPPGKYLVRIDPNGPYSPENCRWGDTHDHPGAIYATIDGIKLRLTEWSRLSGVPRATIWTRVKQRKWKIKNAIFTPLGNQPGDYDVLKVCELLKTLRKEDQ
jgi:hypothetical protein